MQRNGDYWYDSAGNAHRLIDEKLVLLSGPDPVMKSFEDIHKQYLPLIRKKAYGWSYIYEYDELCQVAAIALWKAFQRYDYRERPIPFGAVAATTIKYALWNHHAKNKPKTSNKTSQIRSICSLHDLVGDGEDATELQEMIGEEETFTQETADRILLEKLLQRIPKQQKEDIFSYVDGYKMKELAESKAVTGQQQAFRLRSAFLRFRSLYIKEMTK